MDTSSTQITTTWQSVLSGEKEQDYFKKILAFLERERSSGKIIYPPQKDIFNAFKFTAYSDVRVVILGQDPYHGAGQAHGLSFSVQPGVTPPPSLQNIFLELKNDLGYLPPTHGCLEKWAKQGVLLLNTVLTVEAGKPQSHANIGWQQFTDKVIECLNDHPHGIVFLLWGAPAQHKARLINPFKHHILTAPHPSPLSAHRGFLGCKHFSKTNALLKEMELTEIDWRL
ncbi:MAG: uracil-DNA glycosylase [Proteobacteria bacterium]|nr:uracil-DNA glycosylase [Pseudomonadota bacterium]